MAIDEGLAEEAVQSLRWVMHLQLTPAEWSYADQVMRRLDDALTAGDQDALREAVVGLDQLSRRVAQKLGKESQVEPSPKRRDRANELIHRLTPEPDARQEREKQK